MMRPADLTLDTRITEMSYPTRIVFGVGALERLPAHVERLKMMKPLLVTDAGVVQAGLAEAVLAVLRNAKIEVAVFDRVQPNPSEVDVFAGLRPGGIILINTARSFAELGLQDFVGKFKARAVPATELAMKHVGRPMPNAVLLGAFAAFSGLISLDSVGAAINEKFSGKVAAANVAAATAAYQALGHAQAA